MPIIIISKLVIFFLALILTLYLIMEFCVILTYILTYYSEINDHKNKSLMNLLISVSILWTLFYFFHLL